VDVLCATLTDATRAAAAQNCSPLASPRRGHSLLLLLLRPWCALSLEAFHCSADGFIPDPPRS
jgi:hypothetical protein